MKKLKNGVFFFPIVFYKNIPKSTLNLFLMQHFLLPSGIYLPIGLRIIIIEPDFWQEQNKGRLSTARTNKSRLAVGCRQCLILQ
ncbi:MAG: hypothetical protein LBM25_00075 [Bacteroidales bacterium]|nr:hypothetical protein [Bacteroidales bacterium]